MLRDYLRKRGVALEQRTVLDLASGLGGYAIEWQAQSGRVVALDLTVASPAVRNAGIPFVRADACHLPLLSDSFDVVFCASLIEHVSNPIRLLREIRRVVCPGGLCYLSFPPFYSPRGGHEFSPFHYLGEEAALKLAQRDRHIPAWLTGYYHIPSGAQSYAETYQGWGLYRVTISRARHWIEQAGFVMRHLDTRYSPLNLTRVPILGEVLVWHAQMILENPQCS